MLKTGSVALNKDIPPHVSREALANSTLRTRGHTEDEWNALPWQRQDEYMLYEYRRLTGTLPEGEDNSSARLTAKERLRRLEHQLNIPTDEGLTDDERLVRVEKAMGVQYKE